MRKTIYICACDQCGGIVRATLENGMLIRHETTPLDRPMYAVISNGRLYVVLRELADGLGGIMHFDILPDGRLANPSKPVSSGGVVSCHLAVHGDEVFAVNYLSGNIVSTGGKVHRHEGHGPHPTRQTEAHTHFVSPSPDGQYLLCCDLGCDTVTTYDFDLKPLAVASVPAGAGARHLAFSDDGKTVYCANELGSSVTVFSYDSGRLTPKGTYNALAAPNPASTAAAIRFRGGRVYLSNRGEDTVTVFQAKGDTLERFGFVKTGGHWPRDFAFAGNAMICANERSDTVTVLTGQGDDFVLSDTLTDIPSPICITVLEKEDTR